MGKSNSRAFQTTPARILSWTRALVGVITLLSLVEATPHLWHDVLVVFVIGDLLAVPLLLTVTVALVCTIALVYWTRGPDRSSVIKSGFITVGIILFETIGIHEFVREAMAGTPHLIFMVPFSGVSIFLLLVLNVAMPKWEKRGFIRHPKRDIEAA